MTQFSGSDLVCIRGERPVFAGVGFTLAAGEALVLTGPNGAGKSSLLRIMAGLLKPLAGSLAWEGEAIAANPDAHHDRVHYIGHHDALKPVLTARENLLFWARIRGTPDDTVASRAEDALERFNLTPLADVPGRMLSQGQKRRLSLARLFVAPATLWVLDEPGNGLDRASVARLLTLINAHCDGGGMLALAAHGELANPQALPHARNLDLTDVSRPPPELFGL